MVCVYTSDGSRWKAAVLFLLEREIYEGLYFGFLSYNINCSVVLVVVAT